MIEVLGQFWEESWSHIASHLSYFSGMSMLLPILSSAMQHGMPPWQSFPAAFWIAIALVILGIFVIFWVERRLSRLISKVGWLMLIPGMLALFFAAFSSDMVFNVARNTFTGFAVIEPTAAWIVNHHIPQSVNVASGYVFFGIIFIWMGNKVVKLSNIL